jgi:hypothetical protein
MWTKLKWSTETTKASWIYVERHLLVVKREDKSTQNPKPGVLSIAIDVVIESICKRTRFHLVIDPPSSKTKYIICRTLDPSAHSIGAIRSGWN